MNRHYYKGSKMSEEKNLLRELEDNFRNDPLNIANVVSLAKEHMAVGNENRAREVLDKCIAKTEKAGDALALRAEILAGKHDWIGAYRDIKAARKAGAKVNPKIFIRIAYLRRLILANTGWRPEKLSRISTLVMSCSIGVLIVAMGFELLIEKAYAGVFLSFLIGVGFVLGGIMVGGLTLWLKALQDKLSPGWDQPPNSKKKSNESMKNE